MHFIVTELTQLDKFQLIVNDGKLTIWLNPLQFFCLMYLIHCRNRIISVHNNYNCSAVSELSFLVVFGVEISFYFSKRLKDSRFIVA